MIGARALHTLALVCVIVHATAFAAEQTPRGSIGSGVISGSVIEVGSSQPVTGATVVLRTIGRVDADIDANGKATVKAPPSAVTDSQGRFAFPSLSNGKYTLQVQQRGYASVRGAAVNLAPGQQVTDVVLEAGRHGVIAGTVRDDGGDPVVGVGVRAFSKQIVGFRPTVLPRDEVLTDDRGQFRISNLPPGEYLICACVRDSLPIDKTLLTRVGEAGIAASSVARQLNGAVLTFPPTFHPGSTRMADAVTITVGYSDDRRGIDITMQPAAARRVSGRLVGGGPNASTAHTLMLIHADDDPAAIGTSELPAVRMTPEGAFEFAAVPPGKYTLEAYPSDGNKGLSASVTVTVADADVADVIVPLGPGATVRGRVDFSGAAPRPDGDILEKAVVNLMPLVMTPAAMIGAGASGSLGHSGTLSREGLFSIEGVLPGRYLVNTFRLGPVWGTVESITTTDGRSPRAVLEVVPSGVDPLVITMSDLAMATLEVTVALGKYELSSEVRIAVFPVDQTFWPEPYLAPSSFVYLGPSPAGVVSFPPLPPADYYVVDMAGTDTQMSPERMTEWAKRAITVRLKPGEKTTVALKR